MEFFNGKYIETHVWEAPYKRYVVAFIGGFWTLRVQSYDTSGQGIMIRDRKGGTGSYREMCLKAIKLSERAKARAWKR